MIKLVKSVFLLLSVLLVTALIYALVAVNGNNGEESSTPTVPVINNSKAEDSSADVIVPPYTESLEESKDLPPVEESSEEPPVVEPPVVEPPIVEPPVVEPPVEQPVYPPLDPNDKNPITQPPQELAEDAVDSYFDNAVFAGGITMYRFRSRVVDWRKGMPSILGSAKLAAQTEFGFYKSTTVTYKARSCDIEELADMLDVDTVYLGLAGFRDLTRVGTSDTCARLAADETIACIDRMRSANPNLNIVVLANVYVVQDKATARVNNKNISLLNSYVLEYCNTVGIDFIDIATPLTDGSGHMAEVYYNNQFYDPNEQAFFVWMDILRDYAANKQSGTWQNPQSIRLFE